MKIAGLVGLLMIAGCQTQQAATEPPPRPEDPCVEAFSALGNPYMTDEQKQVMIELMRSNGCMGG